MFIVGITGGIGTGKSSVASILENHSIKVIDADRVGKTLTAPGGAALPMIRDTFGDGCFFDNGELDRKALASVAFADKTLLDQLNLVLHTLIMTEIGNQIATLEKQKKCRFLVLDVPLPVKKGFLDTVNQVWVVEASLETRLERLKQRGIGEADAKRRIASQMTDDDYRKLATHLISNNGSELQLKKRVTELVQLELVTRGLVLSTS